MARITGKYGKIMVGGSIVKVNNENVELNTSPMTIDGKTYQIRQVGVLENKFVIQDSPENPIVITISGEGTEGISYFIDYVNGFIIFSEPIEVGGSVVASYSYYSTFLEVGDMTEWSIDEKVKEIDVTSFGDDWEVYIPLQKSWDASITGHLNMLLWNKALGGTGEGFVGISYENVYFVFMLSKHQISSQYPAFVGQGLLSVSMKTPATGKVEFSGKIKGTGNLKKFTSQW